ncbi:MAG TPA: inositol monophosphatase family protein, partial [Patescibacteria group bacterium]|nr:inositol monophosphatase family protein [Patescibacteria group bacterium]
YLIMDFDQIVSVGTAAAQEAGKYLLREQKNVSVVSQKTPTDWLLAQDKKAEEIIVAKIKETFPDHSILAEESGHSKNHEEYQWIIDPLDGSFNYQHGWHLFGVTIGFAVRDEVQVSVIFMPAFNEMYTAIDQQGAFLNGEKIHVSSIKDLKQSEIIFADFEKSFNQKIINRQLEDIKALANNVGRVRMVGSAALDHVLIASGRAEGLVARGGGRWDIEIGKKLVEEAGGVATFEKDEYGLLSIFGNKTIYTALSEIIK